MKANPTIAFIAFFFALNLSSAQVGINTTNPQQTLDVNGTVKVSDLQTHANNTVQIVGRTANGVLGDIKIGNNLAINNGTIEVNIPPPPPPVLPKGTNYKPVIITDNFANQTKNNYDFQLNGANEDATVFILRQSWGSTQPTTFTGFTGGVDGRVIILLTDSQNLNINIVNQSWNSQPNNRIVCSGNPGGTINVNGFGSLTFVYVGATNRWHLINRLLI